MKQNYYNQFNGIQSIMKTGQDNNVTNHTWAVYADSVTELSWLIKADAVNHENDTGQQYDRS